jgi:sterol desaturase/sphingolipid hydroxylase (fatty acid hydroxylase superfamily)
MIRFILLLAAVSLTLTIVHLQRIETVIAFLAGAVIYAIAEYFVHCCLLHRFPNAIPALYKGHAKHHEHPEDFEHLFSPLWYDMLIYVFYFMVLMALLGDLSLAMAVIAGTSLYQLYYQWMHFLAHRPITPLTRWGKWMKKKHLLHHYLDERSWYGVSHPFLDYLAGTNRPKDAKMSGKTGTSA